MQSYEDFERKQAKEIMKQDRALARVCDHLEIKWDDVHGVFNNQVIPEPLIDKSYRLHQEQRKANKKVNMSFNMLAFAVKQQVSADKQGEKYGIMD